MRRALSIYETALGAEHPDVSAPLNNLAQLYRAEARYPTPSRFTSGQSPFWRKHSGRWTIP